MNIVQIGFVDDLPLFSRGDLKSIHRLFDYSRKLFLVTQVLLSIRTIAQLHQRLVKSKSYRYLASLRVSWLLNTQRCLLTLKDLNCIVPSPMEKNDRKNHLMGIKAPLKCREGAIYVSIHLIQLVTNFCTLQKDEYNAHFYLQKIHVDKKAEKRLLLFQNNWAKEKFNTAGELNITDIEVQNKLKQPLLNCWRA